jgi:hypothetical protein
MPRHVRDHGFVSAPFGNVLEYVDPAAVSNRPDLRQYDATVAQMLRIGEWFAGRQFCEVSGNPILYFFKVF